MFCVRQAMVLCQAKTVLSTKKRSLNQKMFSQSTCFVYKKVFRKKIVNLKFSVKQNMLSQLEHVRLTKGPPTTKNFSEKPISELSTEDFAVNQKVFCQSEVVYQPVSSVNQKVLCQPKSPLSTKHGFINQKVFY